MEKLRNQSCDLLPHSCNLGITAPKSITPPDLKLPEARIPMTNKPAKKLWSVYDGVYWI